MPLALTAAFYWTRELQARFHAGRYAEAVEATFRFALAGIS